MEVYQKKENKMLSKVLEKENYSLKSEKIYLFPSYKECNNSFLEDETYFINNINVSNSEKEYQITNCDFSFPTLKTIEYHHKLTNTKQYFGRTSYITKQIVLFPKINEYITNVKMYRYLEFKTIFVDYPFKAFGEIVGFVYSRFYYYLHKGYLIPDEKYYLTDKKIEDINENAAIFS